MNRFYMDVHVPAAIATGLRRRGIDVLRAQEDNAARLLDSELLDRATALGRVLVSLDKDFTVEVAHRQRVFADFAGVVRLRSDRISVGVYVRELELIASAMEPAELANRITYVPL